MSTISKSQLQIKTLIERQCLASHGTCAILGVPWKGPMKQLRRLSIAYFKEITQNCSNQISTCPF